MHVDRRLPAAFAAVVVAVAGVIVLVLLAAGPHALAEATRERSPFAWLSSVLLAGAGTLALAAALSSRRPVRFALLAAALFALCADERFMGHERFKALLLARLFASDRARMGPLGDLPLPLFLVGVAFLLHSVRAELGRVARPLLVAALGTGALAAALDVWTVDLSIGLFEEVFELCAETLLFLALLVRFSEGAGADTSKAA